MRITSGGRGSEVAAEGIGEESCSDDVSVEEEGSSCSVARSVRSNSDSSAAEKPELSSRGGKVVISTQPSL